MNAACAAASPNLEASPATATSSGTLEDAAMSAALLLTGFAAQDLPAPETYAPTSGGVAATALTHMPDETESWPFAAGKGCFFKGRDGKDFYFLERLFLLLSFPNLAVPGYPGRACG